MWDSFDDSIKEYLKRKKLINIKFIILLKKLRRIKILILTILHEKLTSQKNYDNFAFRRIFNVAQIIWKIY